MGDQSKNGSSSMLANIAVAVTLVLSAVILIGALSHQDNLTFAGIYSIGVTASAMILAGIVLCYIVLIARAPSRGRWAYLVILAAAFGLGFMTAAPGGMPEQHALTGSTGVISLLIAVGFICVPAVYFRLRAPKAVAAES